MSKEFLKKTLKTQKNRSKSRETGLQQTKKLLLSKGNNQYNVD
jgi:hypothetical protein